MATAQFLKLFGVGAVVFFSLDLLWLGFLARGFYQRQLGNLMRPDVRWVPALLFYLVYVAALIVFVAQPALERQSLARALLFGAFFGLTAYAAFDLTSLALVRGFPVAVAVVDLTWGTVLSAVTCGAIYAAGRYSSGG
jgi:uncharacterized membrane protein